jgi:hypothetical protein
MTKTLLLTRMLAAMAITALSTLTTGCTYGQIVDTNFNAINVSGALTFVATDDKLNDTGQTYTYVFRNESWVSFDSYAPDGATNPQALGVANVAAKILPGNYYVEYFDLTDLVYYFSNNFYHTYDSNNCTDFFTNSSDGYCQRYYFEIDPNFKTCHGHSCKVPEPPLEVHDDGIKVIHIGPNDGTPVTMNAAAAAAAAERD